MHVLKSLMAGEPIADDAQSRAPVCVFCGASFPLPGPDVAGATPPPCACGAPLRSAFFRLNKQGVPYHPSQWAKP